MQGMHSVPAQKCANSLKSSHDIPGPQQLLACWAAGSWHCHKTWTQTGAPGELNIATQSVQFFPIKSDCRCLQKWNGMAKCNITSTYTNLRRAEKEQCVFTSDEDRSSSVISLGKPYYKQILGMPHISKHSTWSIPKNSKLNHIKSINDQYRGFQSQFPFYAKKLPTKIW